MSELLNDSRIQSAIKLARARGAWRAVDDETILRVCDPVIHERRGYVVGERLYIQELVGLIDPPGPRL